jgi:hypothetical protein
MKKLTIVLAAGLLMTACHKSENVLPNAATANPTSTGSSAVQKSSNTIEMAYYDSKLFTINLKVQTPTAGTSLITHNKSINNIYRTEGPGETEIFTAVLDAVQEGGPGFNPLWAEQLIVFNSGHTPHQFFSDNEVLAAQASGEINLVASGEVYRCSVIGPKK